MKKLVTIVLLITSLNALAPELDAEQKDSKELIKQNQRDYNKLMSSDFSEDNLRELLKLLNVSHIDIVINQTRLETGWYSSNLFRNHNNLFGMGYANHRESYAYEYTIADNGRKVASYRSWQSSVLDFIEYLKYYESLGNPINDYYSFLEDVGYCEKDSYVNILKKMT